MVTGFAAQIQQMRRARGLSQETLAQRSGVSRSTLSRWERGEHLPGRVELDAVLAVLGASHAEAVSALRSIPAPRAGKLPPTDDDLRPPVGGDLLRALRRRRGKTQEEVARSVGVPRATLARWETSETWPNAARLHALCWELGANPDEVEALTHGRFSPLLALRGKGSTDRAFEDVEAFTAHIYSLKAASLVENGKRLFDLYCILELDGLWEFWRAGEQGAVPRLARAYGFYAQFLMDQGRLAESERHASVALRLCDDHSIDDPSIRVPAQLALAERDVYGDGLAFQERRDRTLTVSIPVRSRRFDFGRGIRRLRSLAEAELAPAYTTWVFAHLARYATGAERHGDADRFAGRAVAVVQADPQDRLWEIRSRLSLQARILLRSGRADQAVAILSEMPVEELARPEAGLPEGHGRTLLEAGLTRAAALLALGRRNEAHDVLTVCRATPALPGGPELDALSDRL